MSFLKEYRDRLLLLFVLIVGAFLRIYHFASWSLSNDELSAIHRASFSTPSEWIGSGSEALDGHPLGVQAFLYFWIQLFGDSVYAVRLPFVMLGVGSVYLIYAISKRWFGSATGLLSAMAVSVSGYFILYSQLARPYSPGLFFSLLVVLFWTDILFPSKANKRSKNFNFIGFGISLLSCMYIHYFSFFFALIVGLTGLFFLNKSKVKGYLLASLAAAALFLPHLSFTMEQLSVGGLTWLAKPTKDVLLTYISNGMNDSDFLILPVLVIAIASFVFYYREWRFTRFHLLAVTFFMVPFLVAYFYSIYKKPVLQYSVLIFSYPFLLMYLFSYMRPKVTKVAIGMLALLALSGIYSLTADTHFYSRQHFGVFKELAEASLEWKSDKAKEGMTCVYNLNHPSYLDYYYKKLGSSCDYSMSSINSGEDLGKLKSLLDSVNTPFFVYGWSTVDPLAETEQIISSQYPFIVEKRVFTNSCITLFSRHEKAGFTSDTVYALSTGFETLHLLENDSILRSKSLVHQGTYSVEMSNKMEYSPTFVNRLSRVTNGKDSLTVRASAWVYLPELNSGAEFVVSFESLNSTYEWHSQKIDFQVPHEKRWTQVFVSRRVPVLPSKEDVLKVYLWNAQKKHLFLDDVQITVGKW